MRGIPGVGGGSKSAPVDDVREWEALDRAVCRVGEDREVKVSSGSKSKSCWSPAEDDGLEG
jgi:hypothetical protein